MLGASMLVHGTGLFVPHAAEHATPHTIAARSRALSRSDDMRR
jgi:hypothetical protein